MRKRTFAKWAALGACVVFVLCFAGAVTINYPFYPAFKKEVNSFDNLQKILRNTPGVFLPDVSSEEFDGWKYALKLDDRNILSKPTGYESHGSLIYSSVEVRYGVDCDKSLVLHSERNMVYRDIEMYYYLIESTEYEYKIDLNIEFYIGDYNYHIYANYNNKLLSESGIDSLNREVKLQMLQFARDIIDGYLLQN